MNILAVLVSLVAGFLVGYALRPRLEQRRRLRRLLSAAARRSDEAPDIATQSEYVLPRDYYLADRSGRGSLAEGFGLQRRATDQPAAGSPLQAELDLSRIPVPRDYYERETPEDEGILSEGYGLRRPGGDAA